MITFGTSAKWRIKINTEVGTYLCVCVKPTRHMQVEGWGVEPKAVLRQRCYSENTSTAVHVPDALLRPAQVGVGHRRTIPEVQLNVCPHGVALKQHAEPSRIITTPL